MTLLRWVLALALYLVALGAKEIAIFYPLVVVAVLWRREGDREAGVFPGLERCRSRGLLRRLPRLLHNAAVHSRNRAIIQKRSEPGANHAHRSVDLRLLPSPDDRPLTGIGPSYPLRVVI